MSDNADLKARIAAVAGKIKQHKQHQSQPFAPNPQYHDVQGNGQAHRVPNGRWSPFGHRGRAGRPLPHKNRTLVLGGNQTFPSHATEVTPSAEAAAKPDLPAETFVTAQGPGRKVLMNKDTFAREQKQVLAQQETARASKRQKVDLRERTSLMNHMITSSASGNREVLIDGIRFQLREDGAKLIRIPDANNTANEIPKKLTIANVDFHRTKNGNFVRAHAVRELIRYYPRDTPAYHDRDLPPDHYRPAARKIKPQCEQFTKHGTCPFGQICKFSHDPDKVAICKAFLKTGTCAAGDSCDLSHVTSYHRVPACTHFLRGKCTKEACPYPHIHVPPSAPVCRAFAVLGFCEKGEECEKRHVFECPDYVNNGVCANGENGKCPLPHPDHASALRKAAARQAKRDSDFESDVSSENEAPQDDAGIDDIDSDEAEDIIMGGDNQDHALTQQQDFIAFT